MNFNEILLLIYGSAIFYLFLNGIVQLNLLFFYKKKTTNHIKQDLDYKTVTIQLPVYNESHVVERLLLAIMQIDYPKELLQIQVLDDSTDETSAIIERTIAPFLAVGFDVCHIKRENRNGFKAGALANGTKQAKGEFIAIFDADFLPKPDFLKQVLLGFTAENIGLVQTRWTHLNEDYSLLTEVQAFALNAHFTVEQGGRDQAGYCLNFNGTAGIWRKTCIEASGGWQFNSIAEDLDLSYRAQLAGWKFRYLENVESPAELPVDMNAIRSQQFRWTKGAAECARLLIKPLFLNKNLRLSTKINGFFHLMNSSGYVLMLLLSLLCYPIVLRSGFTPGFLTFSVVFQANWFILIGFYATAYLRFQPFRPLVFAWRLACLLIFMSGLSLHNGLAVIEGWMGIKTPFIRTPKYNITQKTARWQASKYVQERLDRIVWFEIMLCGYFGWVVFQSFSRGFYGLIPFYGMLTAGYASVIFYTFKHAKR